MRLLSLRPVMIYYVLRFYCRVALWINFRKIYLEHQDRIPDSGTFLFGLNHPTAFLDPILLGTHVDEPCWYMLRGDKFVNRPVKWFLHKIQNLPIFRERDGGRAAVRSNLATMDFATDKLLAGEPTIILSEGLCRHERRLRKIQRGTARMMFQAYRKDPTKPVGIVPAGINYTFANRFRSSVYLTFGDPIYAADFAEAYQADKRETIDQVTQLLEERLRKLVVHVEDPSNDRLVDRLVPIVTNSFPDSGLTPTLDRAPARQALHRAVETVNGMDTIQRNAFAEALDRYERLLEANGLTDAGLANPAYGTALRALGLIVSGPLAILGMLLHYPLAIVTQRQAEKKVANPQFFASVRWGMGLALWLVFVLVWTIGLAFAIGWLALLIPVLFYLAGRFALLWYESFDLWRKSVRIRSVSEAERTKLFKMRERLLTELGVHAQHSTPAS